MHRPCLRSGSRFRFAFTTWIVVLAGTGLAPSSVGAEDAAAPGVRPIYHSPQDVAWSPDGKSIAASDRTGKALVIIDVASAKPSQRIALEAPPTAIAWSADCSRVYVALHGASGVAEVDPAQAKVTRVLPSGLRPMGIAIAAKAGLLLAANSESDSVSLIDLSSGALKATLPVVRDPFFIAVTPDGSTAIVANTIPDGRATDPEMAAALSLIDLTKLERTGDIRLPPGSSNLRGMAISPDGRWAYVAHTVGRTHVPTTQLERGWVNTNALSIVDIPARQSWATVLLDHLMEGAADPWGVAISKDGGKLWVTLAGIHQVARIDLTAVHAFAEGKLPDDHRLAQVASYSPGTESIWFRIKKDAKERAELVNDLAALYAADLIQRVAVEGKGPRGASLAPDEATLAVALYFSGEVLLLDASTLKTKTRISLGEQPPFDLVREGERMFFDASYCFQHWMSCATCHPDTRVDGMNWDLLNDGLGNPKNTRSMLLSHLTPPSMTHGVRHSMEEAVKAGFIHIQFHQPEEPTLRAVEAYLKALSAEPSPSLGKGGEPSDAAKRGKALFFSEKTKCAACHPAPLYTDLKSYDVGTRGEYDRVNEFDTPTLIEVHRTRPYLHDGSAASLREVLVERNKADTHGLTSKLAPGELEDLLEFLKSL